MAALNTGKSWTLCGSHVVKQGRVGHLLGYLHSISCDRLLHAIAATPYVAAYPLLCQWKHQNWPTQLWPAGSYLLCWSSVVKLMLETAGTAHLHQKDLCEAKLWRQPCMSFSLGWVSSDSATGHWQCIAFTPWHAPCPGNHMCRQPEQHHALARHSQRLHDEWAQLFTSAAHSGCTTCSRSAHPAVCLAVAWQAKAETGGLWIHLH